MRAIKFKVWDNQLNQWAVEKDLDYANILNFPVNDYFIKDGHEVVRWSFLQFTGLYDKNKKKIYEGDIVKWKTDIDEDYFGGKLGFTAEIVKFEGGAFYPVCTMDEYEFEVIGNIYENPELLKA